ncbi:MAG: helix-turn-helix domain-containing protein [Candidatus Coproplasma sp.]
MSFAENLQYLRKKNKITQEELAEELNLSRQSVSKWETGEAYPETDKLIALCDKFGVTLDELVRGDLTNEDSIEEVNEAEEAQDVKKDEEEKSTYSECERSACAGCASHLHAHRAMHGHVHTKGTMIGAAISSSVMIVCAIVYLCLGFCLELWHPTWLVFFGGIIVSMWASGLTEKESGKSLKEKIGGLICGTVMIGALLIFLTIGFVCSIWHPTWIAFVVAVAICGVVGTITNKKD